MTNAEMRKATLPEPWEDWTQILHPDISLLNQLADMYLTWDAKITPNSDGDPVAGHSGVKWTLLKNKENGVHVIIGFTSSYVNPELRYALKMVTLEPLAVYFFSGTSFVPLSGTDLRQLPMQSICSAYSRAYGSDTIEANRRSLLESKLYPLPVDLHIDEKDSALRPLPTDYSRQTWFYALAAIQFEAVTERYPEANAIDKMVEINSPSAKSTVQRWITRARNLGLLAPARLVK